MDQYALTLPNAFPQKSSAMVPQFTNGACMGSIQSLKVQGGCACIIWPSDDQRAPHLAEPVVEYPHPVTIEEDRFSLLRL